MLLGGEPLVDFCIAGDTSTEDLAFQPGQFELLIADRVAGTHGCLGRKRPCSNSPGEIAQGEQTIRGELVE